MDESIEATAKEIVDAALCVQLSGLRVGFLINFNTKLLKEGLKRMAL